MNKQLAVIHCYGPDALQMPLTLRCV